MGVDIRLNLPADTRLHDVGTAIGVMLGLPIYYYKGSSEHRYVEGVKTKPSSVETCAEIIIDAPKGKTLIDGQSNHHALYHFENPNGGRVMIPRSTAFWIAVAKRLVDFFGGTLDYQDCDDIAVDYKAKKPRKSNSPEDGKPWHKFQAELFGIKPITNKELREADGVAAYKLEELV